MNTATARISCWRCGQVLWTRENDGDLETAAAHMCPVDGLVWWGLDSRDPDAFLTLEDEVNATAAIVRSAWPTISWWRKIRFSVELPVLRRVARMYDALRRWRAR